MIEEESSDIGTEQKYQPTTMASLKACAAFLITSKVYNSD